MPKVALYARCSSDHQRDASIEDQLRLCRLYAERQGWTVADNYTDRAISGASLLLRPGIQELIHDALRGRFDIVLAEAMDRLSRDQEDIAGLFKRMRFVGVRLGLSGKRMRCWRADFCPFAKARHSFVRGRIPAADAHVDAIIPCAISRACCGSARGRPANRAGSAF